jgi:hypothetical protein
MAEDLGYLLAQSFNLSSSQTMSTTDDRGGPTNRTLAAGWYRTLLANGAGASHVDPAELLDAVETALDATKWTLTMSAVGLVQVTYVGSGNGSVDLSGCTTLRSLLGFTGNTGTLASGATATATYQPTHCVFAAACDPDSGWTDTAARFAGAALPDGTVYGWHDGRANYRRAATLRLLPRDIAARTALGASGTPAFPVSTRWLSPSTSEPAQAPPWAAADTLATAYGIECGVCWGTLQQVIAGSVTAYDKVYFTPEMAAAPRVALSIQNYDARRDVSMELAFAGAGAL